MPAADKTRLFVRSVRVEFEKLEAAAAAGSGPAAAGSGPAAEAGPGSTPWELALTNFLEKELRRLERLDGAYHAFFAKVIFVP